MNLHYPLHTQNIWAAASLRRPATSLRRLALSLFKIVSSVFSGLLSLLSPDYADLVVTYSESPRTRGEDVFASNVLQSLRRWLPASLAMSAGTKAAFSVLAKEIPFSSLPQLDGRDKPSEGRGHSRAKLGFMTSGSDGKCQYASNGCFARFKRLLSSILLAPARIGHLRDIVFFPAVLVHKLASRFVDYRAKALQRAALLNCLERARSYPEWRTAATELDNLEGLSEWKHVHLASLQSDAAATLCDLNLIKAHLADLCSLLGQNDVQKLAFYLRSNLIRNIGGMCHPDLHAYCRVGTKNLVEDYVNVAAFALLRIAFSSLDESGGSDGDEQCRRSSQSHGVLFSANDKLKFCNETRHAYGHTALMLSGGAAMGLNHLGVVKALLDSDLLPRVVSGTSAGAIVASIVGIFNDEELHNILTSPNLINPLTHQPFSFRFFDEALSWRRQIRRLVKKGVFQDIRMLQDSLRKNFGDFTFGEAYARSRRILNITVCPARGSTGPPLLLNYLTTPNVLIWSAVSASCALPFVFAPVQLVVKDTSGSVVPFQQGGSAWIDGSITSDVPLARIGELFNVNHFIVSQTNPHIIPRGLPVFQTRLALLIKSEVQFRYWQALQLKLVPRVISSLFPHIMQPYEGDVTIMPEVSFRDLFNLFRNPTTEAVHRFITRGERQTYPNLDRIRLQCLVEKVLDQCADIVADDSNPASSLHRSQRRSVSSAVVREDALTSGRAPSWLWLDSRDPQSD